MPFKPTRCPSWSSTLPAGQAASTTPGSLRCGLRYPGRRRKPRPTCVHLAAGRIRVTYLRRSMSCFARKIAAKWCDGPSVGCRWRGQCDIEELSDSVTLAARHRSDPRCAARHLRHFVPSEREGHVESGVASLSLAWHPQDRPPLPFGTGTLRSCDVTRRHSELGHAPGTWLGFRILAAPSERVLARPGTKLFCSRRLCRRALPLTSDADNFGLRRYHTY